MMSKYSMVIQWSDEDRLFLVTISEFTDRVVMPCTHGKTREEAIRNGDSEVAEMVYFLSLQTSIDMRSPYAPTGFFPIFLADYYFCGIIATQSQEDTLPILYYCFEDSTSGTSTVSPSLTSLMTAVAECLESIGGISAGTMALHAQGDIPSEKFFPNIFNDLTAENMRKLSPIYEKYNVDYLNIFR